MLSMSIVKLKLIKKIESKVVFIKLLVLVVKAEGEVGEEDVLKDALLKADAVKAVVFQVGMLEVVLVQALAVKVVLLQACVLEVLRLQALFLVKVGGVKAGVLKALCLLLLLEAKLEGLSHANAKLKLITVKAGKLNVVQQAGGKAVEVLPL